MNIIVNKNISKRAFAIMTLGGILIGIFLIYTATEGFIKVNILKNCKKEIAEINDSRIVEANERSSERSSWRRQIKYNYSVDGIQHNGKDMIWWGLLFNSDKNLQIGDKIDIYYNINNPSQSKIYHISYVTILVGICFIVVPSLLLKQRIKEE